MNDFMVFSPYLIVSFWVFVVGLCIGSFLNVVALRGLSGESIVLPPSKCPVCKNKLKWWMNIPVLSYLILRGKCGFCKTKISAQYPIVEFITGLFFLLIFLKFSYSFETIFFMIAFFLLMAMTITDLKESVILDFHAYILIVAGIIYNIAINGFDGLTFALIGGLAGFAVYEIIAKFGYLIVGQRAFGDGDSLIAAGIGAFFGYKWMLISIGLSVIIMAIFATPYFIFHCIKSGKCKTLVALFVVACIILFAILVSKFNLINNLPSSLIFLGIIIGATCWALKQIYTDMNQTDEDGNKNLCALPFGPAMAASFVLIMFFASPIKNIILDYIAQ